MRGLSRRIVGIVLCLAILATGAPAQAERATIEDIIITNTTEDLLLYCTVQGCFSEEMNHAILNGVPTTFTFRIELYKRRVFFPDQQITKITLHRTIKYDTLKNEFTLSTEGEENSTQTVKEFFEAKRLMSEINGLKLVPMAEIMPKTTYYVRIKAELNKVRLPFYLHYVLFFVSLWDFETNWHETYFTY